MFVTTAGRTNQQMMAKAMAAAEILNIPYIPRKKKSINLLQNELNSGCIVVGQERMELFQMGSHLPFFFHPNSAMFRIKRLLNGENDPFTDAAQLQREMTFLDCTLGLASDSIVASFLVGKKGRVTGIEGQKYLAYIVKEGLRSWDSGLPQMKEAMERINVVHSTAYEFLKNQPDSSVDCIYFDPMFEEKILESDGIKALGNFALYDELDEATMAEAVRVARRRVVLKDHYKSKRFGKYGFEVIRRKTAKFHFGSIIK